MGNLNAIVRHPAGARPPLPGVTLVGGSGDSDRFSWGGWPEWIADAGSIVLRHDKPGTGGSPGHWREQTLEDRARESLAAQRVLRAHPSTAGQPVGLYGVSQGGWVALIAAAMEPDAVDFVVCHSGPGTSPAAQERERLETEVRSGGCGEDDVAGAMDWVDARAEMLRRGDPVEAILIEQAGFAAQPWYETVTHLYDTADSLRFLRGILDFDPAGVIARVRCPVLALFGAADPVIPVYPSLRVFSEHLSPSPHHGIALFPHGNHGFFTADPDPSIPRRDQLVPAYLPTITSFLADRRA
jgi:hypothetical protein